jgi:hypothetical protein
MSWEPYFASTHWAFGSPFASLQVWPTLPPPLGVGVGAGVGMGLDGVEGLDPPPHDKASATAATRVTAAATCERQLSTATDHLFDDSSPNTEPYLLRQLTATALRRFYNVLLRPATESSPSAVSALARRTATHRAFGWSSMSAR